jgi:hypothetical protein
MADLVQIRQGFRARWNELTLLVESEDRQWTLRVQDAGSDRVLYTAGRSNRTAAQTAGMEFAMFRGAAAALHATPEALAQGLQWQAYW